jgi:excisionase family DNA binding protein
MERLNFSRREAAGLLGVSLRAVDYAICNDRLDSTKYGRRRMIPRDELFRFARIDQPRFTLPA